MQLTRFQRRESKEPNRLSRSHPRTTLRNNSAQRVQHESFDGMVIQRPEGVRDVEPMVDRVDVLVKVL